MLCWGCNMVSDQVHSLLCFNLHTLFSHPINLHFPRKNLAAWKIKPTTKKSKHKTQCKKWKDWTLTNILFPQVHTTSILEKIQDKFLHHLLWMKSTTIHGAETWEGLFCLKINWSLWMAASRSLPGMILCMKFGKETMSWFFLGLLEHFHLKLLRVLFTVSLQEIFGTT